MKGNIIGIACNTAHIYLDDIKLKPGVTLINLIDEVGKTTENYSKNTVFGLLSSSGTRAERLYHGCLDQHSVKYKEASDNQQKELDKTIDLVMAHNEHSAAQYLSKVIREFSENGVNHFILGCTELPIAFDCMNSASRNGISIIDANWILAKCLVDKYMD